MARPMRVLRDQLCFIVVILCVATPFYCVFYIPKPQLIRYGPSLCDANDMWQCPLPLMDFPSKYRTALPSYRLTACVIEKSMSTFLAAIMCFLHNPTAFRSANRSLTTELYHTRFCAGKNEYNYFGPVKQQKDIKLLTVVRDPLERFVSGYADKCIKEKDSARKMGGKRCYGCQEYDIMCFMQEQYRRILDYSSGKIGPGRRTYYDIHFFPQNWYCSFCSAFSNYSVIRYGEETESQLRMGEDIFSLLRSANVENEEIEYIRKEMFSSRTSHATADTPEKAKVREIIMTSKTLVGILTRMYYHDYIIFGFSFPKTIVDESFEVPNDNYSREKGKI